MLDSYGRKIDYLRVSITDRCNLRCRYCRPADDAENSGDSEVLALEHIVRLVKVGAKIGVRKVRLTGGEPLMRKDVVQLVAEIAAIPGIEDISITTNGTLFAQMAESLKAAGIKRVNFSLDSLDPSKFEYITRHGRMQHVLASIIKALELGMSPVKLNTVVMKGINDDEVLDFVRLAYQYPLHVRFIEFMPIGDSAKTQQEWFLSSKEIKKKVDQQYNLINTAAVTGGGPARYYKLYGGAGTIGFISPMSQHFCAECNRLRITADGQLRGCLFSKDEVSLKLVQQNDISDEVLEGLFIKAIKGKPSCHHLSEGWGTDNWRKMYQIGG